MPANQNPIFTLTPDIGFARLSLANTARDGSGTVSTVFTAQSNGSRVDTVTWTSATLAVGVASSAMVGRIFITNTSGTNPRLIGEVAIPTITPSSSSIGATVTFYFPGGLYLANGQLVQVSQSVYAGVQDQMDVIARGGDF